MAGKAWNQNIKRQAARRKQVDAAPVDLFGEPVKTPRKPRSQHETRMQIACVNWFRYQYPRFVSKLHHSPNGGKRDEREAAQFKAMGTRAGFADLILMVARGGYFGLVLELKWGDNDLEPEQDSFRLDAQSEGYYWREIRSFEKFQEVINWYFALPKTIGK